MASIMSSVQVVVRLRPLNDKEKKHGTLPVISASTNDKTVTVIKGTGSRQARSSFSFDNVFTAFSTQEEVFDATLKPVIKDVMRGYESTVFAYGQTGTGKTHTMEGDLSNEAEHGIIPRSARSIFETLKSPEYHSYTVTCSYLEIYNEELCDLLSDNNSQSKLDIMEGKNGPFCRGLSEKKVKSGGDVLELMQKAQDQRKVGETNMNKQSSRSHCIFTLQVDAKRCLPDGSVFECKGKLHMVDLAGSECAKTASMDGASNHALRERERMNINQSLLTLGRVVQMLKEQSQKKKKSGVRIPYRDSKLTRILQESLGGRCKTCIVATLSPSMTAIEESLSTLNYAQAANGIVNKPVTTSYMSHSMPTASAISDKVSSEGHGPASVEHWLEMECRLEYMQGQVDEAKAALARKHLQQQELVEQAELAEVTRAEMERQYQQAAAENESLKEELDKEVAQKQATEKALRETELALKKTVATLCATQKTEASLTKEAKALIIAMENSVAYSDEMHRIVLKNRDEDIERRHATQQFNSATAALLERIVNSLRGVLKQEEKYQHEVSQFADNGTEQNLHFVRQTLEVIRGCSNQVSSTVSTLKDNGILPTLEKTTSGVMNGSATTREVMISAEKDLQMHFESSRANLLKSAERLNQLESIHNASTSETLGALKENATAANENISNLVLSATKALDGVREQRESTRGVFREILDEWKQATIGSGSKITESASKQHGAVIDMIQTVSSELKCCDDMERNLSTQKSLLETTGASHAQELESEGKLLVSQKDVFAESFERQKALYERVVTNILSGVEELVQQQMAAVTQECEVSYGSTVASNQALAEGNSRAEKSAKALLQSVGSTNDYLHLQVQSVRSNGNGVIDFLNNTGSVLGEIKSCSADQMKASDAFSAKASKYIEDGQDLEVTAQSVSESLQTDGERCNSHLTESVFGDATARITNLAEHGRSVATLTRDEVLTTFASSIENMEKPRDGVMTTFAQECDSIRSCAMEGRHIIDEKVSEMTNALDGLGEDIQNKEILFVKEVADNHQASVTELRKQLHESSKNHENSVVAGLSDSAVKTQDVRTSVDDFAHVTLRAQEQVGPAPERNLIAYSSELTSTPSESIILQDIEKETQAPQDSKLNVEDEDDCDMMPTEAEEKEEVKTTPCSPVLKERPPSRDNAGSNAKITRRPSGLKQAEASTAQKRSKARVVSSASSKRTKR